MGHEGPRTAMGKETPSWVEGYRARLGLPAEGVRCEKCGKVLYPGAWPFCRPEHPEDHER